MVSRKMSPILSKLLNDVEVDFPAVSDSEIIKANEELTSKIEEVEEDSADAEMLSEAISDVEIAKDVVNAGLQSGVDITTAKVFMSNLENAISKLETKSLDKEFAGLQSDNPKVLLTAGLQAADGIIKRGVEALKALWKKIVDGIKFVYGKIKEFIAWMFGSSKKKTETAVDNVEEFSTIVAGATELKQEMLSASPAEAKEKAKSFLERHKKSRAKLRNANRKKENNVDALEKMVKDLVDDNITQAELVSNLDLLLSSINIDFADAMSKFKSGLIENAVRSVVYDTRVTEAMITPVGKINADTVSKMLAKLNRNADEISVDISERLSKYLKANEIANMSNRLINVRNINEYMENAKEQMSSLANALKNGMIIVNIQATTEQADDLLNLLDRIKNGKEYGVDFKGREQFRPIKCSVGEKNVSVDALLGTELCGVRRQISIPFARAEVEKIINKNIDEILDSKILNVTEKDAREHYATVQSFKDIFEKEINPAVKKNTDKALAEVDQLQKKIEKKLKEAESDEFNPDISAALSHVSNTLKSVSDMLLYQNADGLKIPLLIIDFISYVFDPSNVSNMVKIKNNQ